MQRLLPYACNHSGVATTNASGGSPSTYFMDRTTLCKVDASKMGPGPSNPLMTSHFARVPIEFCRPQRQRPERNRATTSARCPLPRHCSGRVLRRPTTSTRGRCCSGWIKQPATTVGAASVESGSSSVSTQGPRLVDAPLRRGPRDRPHGLTSRSISGSRRTFPGAPAPRIQF